MLLLLLLKLLENTLGTHPQRHIMRKGHLGQQFIQKGVNQNEILELHCFFNTDSKNLIRPIFCLFVCLNKVCLSSIENKGENMIQGII